MTLKSYKHKLERIDRRNDRRKARAYLRQKRRDGKPQKPKMETSKKVAIYLFILFNVILIYAMAAMLLLGDLSCLSVLISDIAAQVLTYTVYCLKAYHGKKQEEIIKLKRDFPEMEDEA